MALRLRQIGGGQGFTDGIIDYLAGPAAPGGDGSFQDAAPLGSRYTQTTAGSVTTFSKTTFGGNATTDWTANAVGASGIPVAEKGANNGVATLGATGVIPTSQIPALAITTVVPVATLAAMLALTAQAGDVAVRADLTAAAGNTFMHNGGTAGTVADWTKLDNGYAVSMVNGQAGTVVLSAADVGADAAGAAATVDAKIGTRVSGNYYLAADSLAAADQKIDAQLALNASDITTLQSTAPVLGTVISLPTPGALVQLGSVPILTAGSGLTAAWDVVIYSNANDTVKISISAIMSRGGAPDHDEDAVLETGVGIPGVAFTVTNVGGSLVLSCSTGVASNAHAMLRSSFAF